MPAVIQCPNCSKSYPWKPDLAGKRVRCKCGELIEVPANAPKAEVDELYDLADEPDAKASHPALTDLQSAATTAAVAVDESRQFPCPYCGEMLEPGSTMCVFCGSALQGVAKPAPIQAAMQAAPPVATRPVVMRAPTHQEQQNKLKLIIAGVAVVIVLVAAVIGLKKFSPRSASQDPALKPGDAAILSKIDDEHGKEAREWLNASDMHMMGGWSKKQALYHVDELYQMGAKKIYAFGNGYSMTIAIELPDDPAKRKAIFDWQTRWHSEMHIKPDTDQGQRFIEIRMRP